VLRAKIDIKIANRNFSHKNRLSACERTPESRRPAHKPGTARQPVKPRTDAQ